METSATKSRTPGFHPDWTVLAAGIVFIYAVMLVAAVFVGRFWLSDANGHIVANDFIDVYAAGKLAVSADAASVYDWAIHRAKEVEIAGTDFDGYYGWHYPPPLLFVAVVLSWLPYLVAYLGWLAVTLLLYAFTIGQIAGKSEAILWAVAFPGVFLNAYVGQNGCFTAALFGLFLLALQKRPVVAGLVIGLLTYKPQFGLLIPVALIAGAQWRAILSASVTAMLLALLSLLAFGWDTWLAFFHSIPHTSSAVLTGGQAGWNKLHTVYGFARWAGAGDEAAWAWQTGIAVLSAIGVAIMWRSRAPFTLKAAALCTAVLLATPYAYIYDFPILAIAIAFLYRDALFDRLEAATLLAACFLIASFPWTKAPVGLVATLAVACLISRRVGFLRKRVVQAAPGISTAT